MRCGSCRSCAGESARPGTRCGTCGEGGRGQAEPWQGARGGGRTALAAPSPPLTSCALCFSLSVCSWGSGTCGKSQKMQRWEWRQHPQSHRCCRRSDGGDLPELELCPPRFKPWWGAQLALGGPWVMLGRKGRQWEGGAALLSIHRLKPVVTSAACLAPSEPLCPPRHPLPVSYFFHPKIAALAEGIHRAQQQPGVALGVTPSPLGDIQGCVGPCSHPQQPGAKGEGCSASHVHTHCALWVHPCGQRGWGQWEGRDRGPPMGMVQWSGSPITLTCVFSSSVIPTQTCGMKRR